MIVNDYWESICNSLPFHSFLSFLSLSVLYFLFLSFLFLSSFSVCPVFLCYSFIFSFCLSVCATVLLSGLLSFFFLFSLFSFFPSWFLFVSLLFSVSPSFLLTFYLSFFMFKLFSLFSFCLSVPLSVLISFFLSLRLSLKHALFIDHIFTCVLVIYMIMQVGWQVFIFFNLHNAEGKSYQALQRFMPLSLWIIAYFKLYFPHFHKIAIWSSPFPLREIWLRGIFYNQTQFQWPQKPWRVRHGVRGVRLKTPTFQPLVCCCLMSSSQGR